MPEADDILRAAYPPDQEQAPPSYTTADIKALMQNPSFWERYMPTGSATMQERGPWMRDYLHPQVADFLAQVLHYAPMALPASRAGAGMGRDAVMANSLDKQFPHEAVTGGSAGELAAREGIHANRIDLPTLRDQVGWEVLSGDTKRATNLADLNTVLDQLGIRQPPRQPANRNYGSTPGDVPTPEPWARGMRAASDVLRDARVGSEGARRGPFPANDVAPGAYQAAADVQAHRTNLRPVDQQFKPTDPASSDLAFNNELGRQVEALAPWRRPNRPEVEEPPLPWHYRMIDYLLGGHKLDQ